MQRNSLTLFGFPCTCMDVCQSKYILFYFYFLPFSPLEVKREMMDCVTGQSSSLFLSTHHGVFTVLAILFSISGKRVSLWSWVENVSAHISCGVLAFLWKGRGELNELWCCHLKKPQCISLPNFSKSRADHLLARAFPEPSQQFTGLLPVLSLLWECSLQKSFNLPFARLIDLITPQQDTFCLRNLEI